MKAVMEDMEIVEGFKMALDQVWNQLYMMRSAWKLIIKEGTNKNFPHDSKHLSHALNNIKKDNDNDKEEEKMYVYDKHTETIGQWRQSLILSYQED